MAGNTEVKNNDFSRTELGIVAVFCLFQTTPYQTKVIKNSLGLDYRDASLITLYLVVIGISITKIR